MENLTEFTDCGQWKKIKPITPEQAEKILVAMSDSRYVELQQQSTGVQNGD